MSGRLLCEFYNTNFVKQNLEKSGVMATRNFEEISVDVSRCAEVEDVDAHLMPCSIDYNGSANVSRFFKPSINCIPPKDPNTDPAQHLSASFRGRLLNGRKIVLPADYAGILLMEDNNRSMDEVNLKPINKFSEFTYWNLDCTPSSDDKIVQAIQWIEISKAIHSSVNEVNLSQSSVASL